MDAMTGPELFTAHLGDPDQPPVGEFGLGLDGQLMLTEVDEPYRAALEDILAYVNGLSVLRIKAPGKEPGAITRDAVARGDGQWRHAVTAFLEEKYNLFLVPTALG